jgi:Domain of unknown function (DUF4158)
MEPMASRKRPLCGQAADVAPDRGYFRPQNTSLKPAAHTILIDIFGTRGPIIAHRPLLTDEERRLFFGIPDDPDGLARQYTFTRSDQGLVAARRGAAANQLGFAVQLELLRHPGMGLAHMEEPVGVLVLASLFFRSATS